MVRILVLSAILLLPFFASAQIPVLVEETPVAIENPTQFTTYYGILADKEDSYHISAEEPFLLHLSLLMPDVKDSKLDVSLAVVQDGATATPLTVFDANNAQWELAYDEGAENFFRRHSTFRSMIPAGKYEIRVWSSNNDSKYILEVGDPTESFSLGRMKEQYATLPVIKRDFYGEPVWKAYTIPVLVGPIFLVLLLIALFGVLIHLWRQRI